MNDGAISYDEHLAKRKKWVDGAVAEQLGFQAARWDEKPRQMSKDPYLQQRYDQGFTEAKEVLKREKAKEGM